MTQSNWFFHPILIFIYSILALVTSLFLYIYWYVKVSSGFTELVEKFDLPHDKVLDMETWVVILLLTVLVGIILIGMIIIFIYHQKTFQLYRLQNNFINNYTHELKTPVTSIQLYLETFLNHQLSDEDQKKYIKFMLLDVERLSEHINNILNISRFETQNKIHDVEPVDFVQFIEDFIASNQHCFSKSIINFEYDKNNRLFFNMNVALFEMLFRNIMNNAIIYNDNPTPEITIRLTEHKKKIVLSFADNGIGVEKKYRRKIFNKFFQIGQADDRSAKGSGLGLYMVHSITQMHGGKISILDHSKQGSIFQFMFPFHPTEKNGDKI
ncbi:integral membrane sensor signal transduction histidine kinase [Candidatus Magnetomorum sp. HK-1]|nr:integral membrane sensor signal transduction histidine kinase [Candidatus Magnetomorum sp. HK-1]